MKNSQGGVLASKGHGRRIKIVIGAQITECNIDKLVTNKYYILYP